MRYKLHIMTSGREMVIGEGRSRPYNAKIGEINCRDKDEAMQLADYLNERYVRQFHRDHDEETKAIVCVQFYGPKGSLTITFDQLVQFMDEYTSNAVEIGKPSFKRAAE